MATNANEFLNNLTSSTGSSPNKTPQVTVAQALKVNFKMPSVTSTSKQKVEAKTNGSGLVGGNKGAMAGVGNQVAAAKAALTNGLQERKREMLSAAKEAGVAVTNTQPKGDIGNLVTAGLVETVSSGLGEIGEALAEGGMSVGERVEDQASNASISPQDEMAIQNQLCTGPNANIWESYYEAGYGAEDLLCLDDQEPNIPEFRALTAIEHAVEDTDNTLSASGEWLDTAHVGLHSEGLCSTSLSNLKCGMALDPMVAGKIAKSTDPENTIEYKPNDASHSFNPVA